MHYLAGRLSRKKLKYWWKREDAPILWHHWNVSMMTQIVETNWSALLVAFSSSVASSNPPSFLRWIMGAVLYGLISERKSASELHNFMISLGHALPLKLLVKFHVESLGLTKPSPRYQSFNGCSKIANTTILKWIWRYISILHFVILISLIHPRLFQTYTTDNLPFRTPLLGHILRGYFIEGRPKQDSLLIARLHRERRIPLALIVMVTVLVQLIFLRMFPMFPLKSHGT